MDFIPLLPTSPTGPAHCKISPTDVSQYLRLDQCQRYLRLRLHERLHGRQFLYRYGVAPQSIPPILTQSGASFETTIEQQVADRVTTVGHARLINCHDAAVDDEVFAAADHNAVVIELARDLPPGELLFIFQPRLRVTLGAWHLTGDVDILRLERDRDGALHVLITDMKSSTAAKVEHRLQVAFYHEMLATLFADADVDAEITTAILYRGPAVDAVGLTPDALARHEAQRAQAHTLFGVEGRCWSLYPRPRTTGRKSATWSPAPTRPPVGSHKPSLRCCRIISATSATAACTTSSA